MAGSKEPRPIGRGETERTPVLQSGKQAAYRAEARFRERRHTCWKARQHTFLRNLRIVYTSFLLVHTCIQSIFATRNGSLASYMMATTDVEARVHTRLCKTSVTHKTPHPPPNFSHPYSQFMWAAGGHTAEAFDLHFVSDAAVQEWPRTKRPNRRWSWPPWHM